MDPMWIGVTVGLGLLASDVGLDEMRRAVDRAYTAELAGDFDGATAGIRRLISTSTLSSSARIRAQTYLEGLQTRRDAFARHGRTSAGFAAAFATLRTAPERWSELMWRRARDEVPELAVRVERSGVRVRTQRVKGRDEREVRRFVARGLGRRGLTVTSHEPRAPAALDLRFDLDAADVREDRTRHLAQAEGSYILRETAPPRSVLGTGAQSHAARRKSPEAARRWASRKALDELVDEVTFDVRLALLSEARAEGPDVSPPR
jgi:hypothetical protein